jgi:hypothetical protein
MRLFPFEHLVVRTSLTEIEIVEKLESSIEPKRLLRIFDFDHKPYQGKIEDHSFSTERIISYRNSSLPQIKGTIEPEIGGCKIEMTMSLHPFAALFTALWVSILGLTMVGTLISGIQSGNLLSFWELLPTAGMIIFGYGLTLGAFKIESVKSKTFFRELFRANQVDELGFQGLFRKNGEYEKGKISTGKEVNWKRKLFFFVYKPATVFGAIFTILFIVFLGISVFFTVVILFDATSTLPESFLVCPMPLIFLTALFYLKAQKIELKSGNR